MSAIEDIPEGEQLTKVDSAVGGLSSSPPKDAAHRRKSSSVPGVFRIEELEAIKRDIAIAPETQKLGWKINTSPNTIEEKEYLKKMLTEPPVRKIDLHFPLGLEVTARNLKGVTIKDACDAIHKQFRKKKDDELEAPYLLGFEFDPDESRTKLFVHCKKTAAPSEQPSKKSKKKAKEETEA